MRPHLKGGTSVERAGGIGKQGLANAASPEVRSYDELCGRPIKRNDRADLAILAMHEVLMAQAFIAQPQQILLREGCYAIVRAGGLEHGMDLVTGVLVQAHAPTLVTRGCVRYK